MNIIGKIRKCIKECGKTIKWMEKVNKLVMTIENTWESFKVTEINYRW